MKAKQVELISENVTEQMQGMPRRVIFGGKYSSIWNNVILQNTAQICR